MQDDIAEAAHWAVAQGHADPKRIGIAGASDGGDATLTGLVNDPGLYKCGVSRAGFTDINLMYDGHRSFLPDLPEKWIRARGPRLVAAADPGRFLGQGREVSR